MIELLPLDTNFAVFTIHLLTHNYTTAAELFIPLSYTAKLRPRERKELSQSHTERKHIVTHYKIIAGAIFGAHATHTNSSRNQRKTGSPVLSYVMNIFVKNEDKC